MLCPSHSSASPWVPPSRGLLQSGPRHFPAQVHKTQAGCPADYYCASDQKCHLGAADGGAGFGAGGAGGAALDGPGNTGGARDGALTYGGVRWLIRAHGGWAKQPRRRRSWPGQPWLGGVAGGPVNGGASGGALPGSGGSPGDASHGTGGMAPDAPLSAGGAGSPDALITPDASTTLAIGATCTSPSQCTTSYKPGGTMIDRWIGVTNRVVEVGG